MPVPAELRRAHWKSILQVTAGAFILIGIAVFLIPPTYEATTSFVPVKDQRGAGSEGSAGLVQALGLGVNSSASGASAYPVVLRSRSLIEPVITRPIRDPASGRVTTYLDAMNVQNPRRDRRLWLAVLDFQSHLRVLADQKSGVFYVTLEGANPGLITMVANDLVAELQLYTLKSRAEIAGQNREFVEREKAETSALLKDAEAALRDFRERNLRIGNSPQLLLEQDHLERNLRVQEEVYLALVRQYEYAKLDEDRSTPLIQVLDPAITPPFKTAPHRLLLLVLGVGAVFLTSLAVSIWLTSPADRP